MKLKGYSQQQLFHLIVIAYVVLAVIYTFTNPPYEAPDESYHVGMVMVIAATGELPVQRGEPANSNNYGYFQEARFCHGSSAGQKRRAILFAQ
jgi:hypothetical protein